LRAGRHWLFKHGNRVSDPLRLEWQAHINLQMQTYLCIGKANNEWKAKPSIRRRRQ
jgi:hypothetical protein